MLFRQGGASESFWAAVWPNDRCAFWSWCGGAVWRELEGNYQEAEPAGKLSFGPVRPDKVWPRAVVMGLEKKEAIGMELARGCWRRFLCVPTFVAGRMVVLIISSKKSQQSCGYSDSLNIRSVTKFWKTSLDHWSLFQKKVCLMFLEEYN